MGLVDGQRILITGASQGLGAGIAHTLATEGAATLLLTARSLPRGTAVAAALRAAHPAMDVTFLPADLAVPADVEAVVRAADAAAITCLVNAAGDTARGTVASTPRAELERSLAVNFTAPFLLAQGAIRRWAADGYERGRIVNVSSSASRGGAAFLAGYSASKGALDTLTRNIAGAYAAAGVRCNGVAPDQIVTEGEHAAMTGPWHGRPADWVATADRASVLGRILRPADIAGLVAFLLSDGASMINGEVIDIGHQAPMGYVGKVEPPQQ